MPSALSADGNVVEREVTIAFRESKQREQVMLERPFRIVHGLERIAAAAEGRPAPW